MEYVMKYNFDEVIDRKGTHAMRNRMFKIRFCERTWEKRRCLAVMGCRYGF